MHEFKLQIMLITNKYIAYHNEMNKKNVQNFVNYVYAYLEYHTH
jgi:hypothetical protein